MTFMGRNVSLVANAGDSGFAPMLIGHRDRNLLCMKPQIGARHDLVCRFRNHYKGLFAVHVERHNALGRDSGSIGQADHYQNPLAPESVELNRGSPEAVHAGRVGGDMCPTNQHFSGLREGDACLSTPEDELLLRADD